MTSKTLFVLIILLSAVASCTENEGTKDTEESSSATISINGEQTNFESFRGKFQVWLSENPDFQCDSYWLNGKSKDSTGNSTFEILVTEDCASKYLTEIDLTLDNPQVELNIIIDGEVHEVVGGTLKLYRDGEQFTIEFADEESNISGTFKGIMSITCKVPDSVTEEYVDAPDEHPLCEEFISAE